MITSMLLKDIANIYGNTFLFETDSTFIVLIIFHFHIFKIDL